MKPSKAIYVQRAKMEDLDAVMELIEDGRKALHENGIPQWQDGYPSRLTMQQDIDSENCYLLMYGDDIAGCATLMLDGDTYYTHIVSGMWAKPGHAFATIHRVAISSKFRGMRLAAYLFSDLISIAHREGVRNFRVSTHKKNIPMQKILGSFGFVERGTVYTGPRPTDLRNAYEMNLQENEEE